MSVSKADLNLNLAAIADQFKDRSLEKLHAAEAATNPQEKAELMQLREYYFGACRMLNAIRMELYYADEKHFTATGNINRARLQVAIEAAAIELL
jgi:hypothetical protein